MVKKSRSRFWDIGEVDKTAEGLVSVAFWLAVRSKPHVFDLCRPYVEHWHSHSIRRVTLNASF